MNRPFDDQEQCRIRIETEAILEIRKCVEQEKTELVWSYVIDYEIQKNPIIERRLGNAAWKNLALIEIGPSTLIVSNALELRYLGFKDVDSLHVACAMEAEADSFVTTDDAIIKRSVVLPGPLIISNPADVVEVIRKL